MRTLQITGLFLIISSTTLFAQRNKQVSAYNYEKAYRRDQKCSDLAKAKEAIESAAQDAKTKDEAKTWYYRGNIYFDMLASKDQACKSLSDKALDECFDSYMKTLMLNFDDPELKKLDILNNQEDGLKFVKALSDKNTKYADPAYNADIIGQRLPALKNEYINLGVNHFQNTKDYKAAVQAFEQALAISGLTFKVDTTVLYYAALASQNAKDNDKAIQYYSMLEQLGYAGPEGKDGPIVYLNHVNILLKDSMNEKAVAVLKKGREKYPSDKGLLNAEINYYIAAGKNQEAIQSLNQAIEHDPENALLYAIAGTVYEGLKENDKAIENYKKAIELDPENFDANFNLGALYFNTGAELNNEANEYGIKEQDKYNATIKKANDSFKMAMPYLEKANQINPKDVSVVKPLLKVYATVNETEKYKALKAKYQ